MKKRVICILTVMALLLAMFPLAVSGQALTLQVTPSVVPGGEVTISGNTGLNDVNIKVLRENNTILYVDVVTANGGTFSKTFRMPVTEPMGTYTVVAGQGDLVVTQTFVVADSGLSGNNNLAALVISAGTLTPAFSAAVTSYTATVPNNVNSITVKPTVADSKATVTVNGKAVVSGQNSDPITLTSGPNTITIVVTAENYTTKTYTIVVTREPDTNNYLGSLTTNIGTLVPAFDKYVTNYTVTLDSGYAGAIPQISASAASAAATANITQATAIPGTASVLVTAESGATKTYTVKIAKRQPIVIDTTGATEDNPEVVTPTVNTTTSNFELPAVTVDDAVKAKVVLDVPAEVEVASITVPTTPVPGGNEAVLPQVEVTAATSIGDVEVVIPAGTTVTGPAAWDGTITLPTVKPVETIEQTTVGGDTIQTVSTVIEVGLGDLALSFDKPVRILLPGQSGNQIAVRRGGVVSKITATLTEDTQAAAIATLVGGVTDAKITVGADVAVWTNHFTEFFAYTTVTYGGGGGGGGYTGSYVDQNGATATRYGATVEIPAGAMTGTALIKIERVSKTGLEVAANQAIVSDVYEITKSTAGAFQKPITITLSYDQGKVNANDTISIYWYNETTDKWVELDNVVVNRSAAKVTGEVDHLSKFAVITTSAEEVGLTDIAGHWAEANIQALVDMKAITGYPDGTFKPDNTITRAEFATVLVKAYDLELQSGKVFNDTQNHWAKEYIATAAANGIIQGYSDTEFGPDDKITREQMAVMIIRAEGADTAAGELSFTDSESISSWAVDAVITAAELGIITGYPDNSFKPQGNATRAEAATVIIKAIN